MTMESRNGNSTLTRLLQQWSVLLLISFGYILSNCESSPLPAPGIFDKPSFIEKVGDVLEGKRDINLNTDGSVSFGRTKEEIAMYVIIGIVAVLLLVGCCVCCCRRRNVHVHTAVIHANPNAGVGYYK